MTEQPTRQDDPAEQERFVAHLPFAAPDLDEATRSRAPPAAQNSLNNAESDHDGLKPSHPTTRF